LLGTKPFKPIVFTYATLASTAAVDDWDDTNIAKGENAKDLQDDAQVCFGGL
jgi:hypothetical protein